VQRILSVGSAPVATCSVVHGELVFGALLSDRAIENYGKIQAFMGAIEVLPVTDRAADLYGKLKDSVVRKYAPRVGKKLWKKLFGGDIGIQDNDLWIASVAIDYGLTVVSDDTDFMRISAAYGLPKCESWLV
jgi:predicted nucleic acid-binding protein